MPKLHYRQHDAIAKTDQVIVFLHGLFAQGAAFSSIARSLGDCATTVLVDLLNHGKSPWTKHFDYLEQVDAVAEVLAELRAAHGAEHATITLVGHSMGGKVAMLTALLRPELVDHLGVLDMSPGTGDGTGEFERNAGLLLDMDLAAVKSRDDADAILAQDIDQEMVRGFLLQNLQRDPDAATGWSWKANLQLIREEHEQVASWPAQADEKQFAGSTLFVGGGESDYIDPENFNTIRQLFPSAELVMLPESGHWVHAEQPARVTELIRQLAEC